MRESQTWEVIGLTSAPREFTVYRFGGVMVDVGRQLVSVCGKQVALEPKVFRLLVILIENHQRVVEKEELFDSVWHGAAVTDNALTRSMVKLRQALGDDARCARYIETIPKVGYRFVAELTVEAQTDKADASAIVEESPAAQIPSRRRRFLIFALGLMALVVAPVAGLRLWKDRPLATQVRLQPRQLTSSTGLATQPALSPSGSEVAYCSDRAGQLELFVRQIAPGGREVQVTFDSGGSINPAWSRDGREIAYHSLARGGRAEGFG